MPSTPSLELSKERKTPGINSRRRAATGEFLLNSYFGALGLRLEIKSVESPSTSPYFMNSGIHWYQWTMSITIPLKLIQSLPSLFAMFFSITGLKFTLYEDPHVPPRCRLKCQTPNLWNSKNASRQKLLSQGEDNSITAL